MLKAYLRHPDYIKPDYQHGRRSRYREQLITEMISCEENIHRSERAFEFKSSLLGIVQPTARQQLVEEIMELCVSMDYLEDMNTLKAIKVRSSDKRKSAKEVYEIMEKQGFWDDHPDFTQTQWNEIIERIKLKFKERRDSAKDGLVEQQ